MDVYRSLKKYKLKIKGTQIYDPIREKYVHLTPEERVRQKTICFLTDQLHVPKDCVIVEKSLSSLGDIGNRKRIDIGVLDSHHDLAAIIECKADYVGDAESPYIQALDYTETLRVKYYFVSDGYDIVGFQHILQNNQFLKLDTLLDYSEIIQP